MALKPCKQLQKDRIEYAVVVQKNLVKIANTIQIIIN